MIFEELSTLRKVANMTQMVKERFIYGKTRF